ncbi:hypothetical protein LRS10_03630 [Phenylobacterium sp. J426]|uniref:hypothetical protein n=1 Tax=Phenylobacterium sp. J426 TaxID=2898439 RepID=UPI0021514D6A|nr:hypothetical protein [Phenylobacterium sp. J426]MCR5873361.1 hypothetical protein [Phenylobacterium sp. J426]
MEEGLTLIAAEEYCTLLCVRADGIAPVVDLAPWTELEHLQGRAERLLREHQSCDAVELWRGGALVDRIVRS